MGEDTQMVPGDERPTIHEAMRRIIEELPAIGKNQRNDQQGFNFRGIDDVVNALKPLLARHGVFFVPDVLERVGEVRAVGAKGDKSMYVVHLHVRYRFYGPRGDSVEASGWGEGSDMGDKATNKAMTGAMKYVLFQTFAIATQDIDDADATTPEETTPLWQVAKDRVMRYVEGDVDAGGNLVRLFFGETYPGSIHQVDAAGLRRLIAHVDELEREPFGVAATPAEESAPAPAAATPEGHIPPTGDTGVRDADKERANAEQLAAIRTLVARIDGITEEQVCETAKVWTLDELDKDTAARIIQTLQDSARRQTGARR